MQQIEIKRDFSILFDAVKTENVQYYSEEKIQHIKKIVIQKLQKRNLLKFEFKKNPDRFFKKSLWGILAPYQNWYQQ